ncbi:Zn-dependent protease [Terriglobus roseus DSM 18391]|uniref:Zn-dependent protease n=1 Tax=Terriglobus roseus (strain DSM 18391 / NRRL B-41598 / KBS 63) TaxID=926566 RepID=I3ZK00_TERRK|nr:site-2 protease family protein [Terriglobus roseus]AFL89568.1 Zn-dependent protease [Terriglobus roseus DSM 18391]
MNQEVALILFEFAALVFALTFHEFAHAWTASFFGDQTARMMGRVTLNPIKHLDPLGSVVLPLVSAFAHFPLLGWAKPTPVTTRNLRNVKRDDILVTLAGPASNVLLAVASLVLLLVIKHVFPTGQMAVLNAALLSARIEGATLQGQGAIFPISLLLYSSVVINLLLAIFNLLPVPPLDGSRILRHYLPYNALQMYDNIGGFANLIILYLLMRSGVLNIFFGPAFSLFNRLLLSA